jgi:SHS2 domain-containing protein
MFEVFDHTADLGLRVQAQQLDDLFAEAGRALFSVIVENLHEVQPRQSYPVQLKENTLEYMFFDWLDTLLYLFDAKKLLLREFEVQVMQSAQNAGETGPGGREASLTNPHSPAGMWKLTATVRGEPLDRTRHQLDHEVKAITYHGLKVERTADGWLAEVIVDI